MRSDPGFGGSLKLLIVVGLVSGIETFTPNPPASSGIISYNASAGSAFSRYSVELIFTDDPLAPVDLRFDSVLEDAAGFGERSHNGISTASARIDVPIGGEPHVLPDRIFVLRHRRRPLWELASFWRPDG